MANNIRVLNGIHPASAVPDSTSTPPGYADKGVTLATAESGGVHTLKVAVASGGATSASGPDATGTTPTGNPVQIAGVSVNPTAPDAFADDVIVPLQMDMNTGAVLVNNRLLTMTDIVTATPPKSTTGNTPAIVTSGGDVIASNAARKSWAIQNLGQNPLFVRMETGASSTVFHRVLKGATANDDGTGGVIEDEIWTGVVSVAGTSPRLCVTEIS